MKPARNQPLFLHQSGNIYYVTTNGEGAFVYANELYHKKFHEHDQSQPHSHFQSALAPGDMDRYKSTLSQCLANPGKNFAVDLRTRRSNEELVWIAWEFCACPGEDKIEGLGTDVSDRKKAETERKEAQERLVRERYLLRTLIDHLPDAIYVKDKESRHIINNKASLELIGAESEAETIGKSAADFFGSESGKEMILTDQKLFKSGAPFAVVEESITTKKQEKKWLLTTKVLLKQENDEVIGLVGISRDITERRQIEESLRRSIERFSIVSRATNDAIWDWDLIDQNVVWNDAVVLLFGYTHAEIAEDKEWWENHIHPQDKSRVLKKIHRHIDKGIESWQDEYRFRSHNGSYKLILDRGFILFDDQHKPYRMIGAMMDITERKKLQDELAAHNVARQRQVTEATIMAQEKERAEMGRELHDNINQILTTTKMYLDMALTEKDISEELMIKSHENISNVIEEIRILSKSLVPPSLGDIGLKEAILEMINNLKISQKMDIKLRTTGFGKTIIPKNVQLMVFRIAQEQMNNVVKHAKATDVEIKLVVTKESLNLAVSDNGVGFDTKKRMKGIGLMNITSRAEVHDGTVEIDSSPGNGCVLKVSIPIKT